MDLTTVLGVAGAVALALAVIATGQASWALLNVHGLLIVIGGVFVAMMINTPWRLLWRSMRALFLLFRASSADPQALVPVLVAASQGVHARGINTLGGLDPTLAGGFLARAAQVAMEFKDAQYVQEVLECEMRLDYERRIEIVNVYRTLSLLFPMFGLVGTLLGIVDVLKHISNPETVGPAMAVAITSAFYGISLANLFATPVAGKLRLKFLEDYQAKAVIVEGIAEILKGTVPVLVERKLEAHLAHLDD